MPEYQETIPKPGKSIDELQDLAYGVFLSLNWKPLYAGPAALIALTEKKWNNVSQQFTINFEDGFMHLKSTMINNEAFDLPKRNKKNVHRFLQAFNEFDAGDTSRSQWRDEIEGLKVDTLRAAEEEIKEAEAVQKVMGSGKTLYVTYSIIAINVLVFIWMITRGVHFMSPTSSHLLIWGGNHLDFTTTGEWWRLLTSMFLHGGIVHLLFNMYALYMACIYLEPMLGPKRLAIAYLCTGVFGSLASLAWHTTPVVSVGASGAIFGLYGVFLALLSTQLIPKRMRQQLLQSIGIFVVYNLVYGLKSGIDNAAHVGGLVSGLLIGFALYPGLKKKTIGEDSSSNTLLILVGIAVATVVIGYASLKALAPKASLERKQAMESLMTFSRSKDGDEYLKDLQKFGEMEDKALAPLKDSTAIYNQNLVNSLERTSIPAWNSSADLITKMKSYDISKADKERLNLLSKYVVLRQEQVGVIKKYVGSGTVESMQKLDEMNDKIDDIIREIKNINPNH